MTTDIERAFNALKSKQSKYSQKWDYYDGNQPLVYSTRRLREVFNTIDARFSQNWCAVVINAAADRISLSEFSVKGNKKATDRLNELFDLTDLDLDADDLHKAAMVCSEGFVIAWKDAITGEVEAYYNDPRQVHIEYDEDSPRKKRFAAKWWNDDENKWHLTLYYSDRLEYYVTTGTYKSHSEIAKATAFVSADEAIAPNPYGEIPVFRWTIDGRGSSDIDNIIEPQNAVNKLVADMMIAAEFGAMKQRYVITNANASNLKNSPNEIWNIPAGDGQGQQTQVGEFGATELSNYTEAIDRQANFIATVSRTPKHYLTDTSGTLSGEALIAMEAPLNKRCKKHINRFSATWQKLAVFLLKLDGITVDLRDVSVVFDAPETVQPKTEAEVRQINSSAEIPLVTSLRWEGKSQEEIDTVTKEKEQEKVESQNSFANALLENERRFSQGSQVGGMTNSNLPQPMSAPSLA